MPDEKREHIIGDGVPSIENDPEVLAEERRLRIRLLRLQYYKALAGTVKVFLQTFKTEATSLVTGVGTLVVGYYQMKKWVLKERSFTVSNNGRAGASVPHQEMTVDGSGIVHVRRFKARAAAERKVEPRQEVTVGAVVPAQQDQTFVSDPSFYLLLALGAAFGISSTKMLFTRIRSIFSRTSTGGSDGPL